MQREDVKNRLVALESRVDELIQTMQHLSAENTAMRNQQDKLISERSALLKKTEQVRLRIESMISRFRTMGTRS